VHDFLQSNHINATTISPAGDWLSFSIPVSQANELFDANFTEFTHEATGKQAIRTLGYSIPASLKNKIDFIHPTIAYVELLIILANMCIKFHNRFPVFDGEPTVVETFRPGNNITSPSSNAVPPSCNNETTPACRM
jgi:tripeptidyl-peptidase-1